MTYYVSAFGCDTSDGGTPETALRTPARANALLQNGDTVLFRHGDTFYGQLRPKEHCTIGAYGEGNNPVISQFKYPKRSAYEKIGASLWRVDLTDPDAYTGNTSETDTNAGFLFVNGTIFHHKIFDRTSFAAEYDFANDDRYFYLYAAEPPEGLAVACNIHCVCFADGLSLSDIDFSGTGGHGVCGTVRGAHIARCGFDMIGGSELPGYPVPHTRYGNGVECWTDSCDVLVEDCAFSSIYDVGVTMQGNDVRIGWKNIRFCRNRFERCTQCFEIWSSGSEPETGFQNCAFLGNTCLDTGFGWGYDARPDKVNASPLLLYGLECPLCDVTVRGNRIGRCRTTPVFKSGGASEMPDSYRIEDNEFFDLAEGQAMINGDDEAAKIFADQVKTKNSVTVSLKRKAERT